MMRTTSQISASVRKVPLDISSSPKNKPSISVVIPFYSRSDHLREALTAWQRCTYDGKLEIVVASYSTDSIIFNDKTTRNVFINTPNWNIANAFNIGARATTSEIIVFTTADILPADNFLSDLNLHNFSWAAYINDVFLHNVPHNAEAGKLVVVKRWLHTRVNGFNELMMETPVGWGYEFEDYTTRLRLAADDCGEVVKYYDSSRLSFLTHSDESRLEPYPTHDITQSYTAHKKFSNSCIVTSGFELPGETGKGGLPRADENAYTYEVR